MTDQEPAVPYQGPPSPKSTSLKSKSFNSLNKFALESNFVPLLNVLFIYFLFSRSELRW